MIGGEFQRNFNLKHHCHPQPVVRRLVEHVFQMLGGQFLCCIQESLNVFTHILRYCCRYVPNIIRVKLMAKYG